MVLRLVLVVASVASLAAENAPQPSLARCAGQMGVGVSELQARYPAPTPTPAQPPAAAGQDAGAEGAAVLPGIVPPEACTAVQTLAAPLLDPAVQKADSVDGKPEFQLDILEADREGEGQARSKILALLWPALEARLLPELHRVTSEAGCPFPIDDWPAPCEGCHSPLRISDMFVRRYVRPPRGARRQPGQHRWSIAQHQDASELSVSVELSDPAGYEGGLYLGKRLGYSAREGWVKAPTLPPMAQGSAVVHRGNLTHGCARRLRTQPPSPHHTRSARLATSLSGPGWAGRSLTAKPSRYWQAPAHVVGVARAG